MMKIEMRDTIDMAREVKMPYDFVTGEPINIEKLKAFEALVRADERALAAPVQERTDYAVHLNHCNIGECEGVCKYLDDDCPALKHADMKAKWDRLTPPAAQRQWVGLTIGEIQDLIQFKEHSPFALAEDVEAKLKEKNNG